MVPQSSGVSVALEAGNNLASSADSVVKQVVQFLFLEQMDETKEVF